jgi:acetyltransferase
VTLRPIRAEDEPLVAKLHETLSDESVYSRFFRYMPLSRRVAHERLSRICFVDYDLEIGIVMEYKHPETEEREILGIGRLIRLDNNEAEFAVLVSDNWQRQGIGSKLLATIVEIGRQEKLSRIIGTILPENYGMQRVSRKVGFEISRSVEDRTVLAAIEL